MSAKRPEPVRTLGQPDGQLLGELYGVPAPATPPPAEPPPPPEDDGGQADVVTELAATPKRKLPKYHSGTKSQPYPRRDGKQMVKTALNFTEGFAADFDLFAAQHLRLSSKSAWAERVLAREMARTRKRADKP